MSDAPPSTTRDALPQCAGAVLMVRPTNFGFNPETAASNRFQQATVAEEAAAVAELARTEFAQLARALEGEGIEVYVLEDTPTPVKPDAVFPNNWVSFHADGTLVLYPMANPSRRAERSAALIESAVRALGLDIRRRVDLTHHEQEGKFLEGTGSLVLDHRHRIAYACPSLRTDPQLVREWARTMDYEPHLFTATDAQGEPYYHTNVCLWIGEQVAAVGLEAVAQSDRAALLSHLSAGGRQVVQLTRAQIARFAGNMLELASWDEALGDSRVLLMSATARSVLSSETYAQLAGASDTVLTVPIPTIERVGGGSVRCMLAEVFRA